MTHAFDAQPEATQLAETINLEWAKKTAISLKFALGILGKSQADLAAMIEGLGALPEEHLDDLAQMMADLITTGEGMKEAAQTALARLSIVSDGPE